MAIRNAVAGNVLPPFLQSRGHEITIFAVKVVTSSLSKFVYNRCHNQALVTTNKTEEYEVI